MDYLWRGEKKKSMMTSSVDLKQLELLSAEIKKTSRGKLLFVCLQGRHQFWTC